MTVALQAVILLAAMAAGMADGKPRTKTEVFRWAGEIIPPKRDEPLKRARKWHHRPLWHRFTARAVMALLAAEALFGVITHNGLVLTAVIVAVIAAATVSAYRGYGHVRNWGHRQQLVPCRDELGGIIGVKPYAMTAKPDGSRIEVPVPYAKRLTPEQLTAMTVTVNQHYPAPEPLHGDFSELRGKHPFARFTRHEPPPPTCGSADIAPAIQKAREHEIVFGLAGGSLPFIRSLDSDIPHLGLSMKSGGGKTTCAMNIIAQVLYHGGIVIILDNKVLSLMQFDGLNNVVYAYTPEMIHEALLWLAWDEWQESELTYRKRLGRANYDIETSRVTADLGPRVLIVAEELNSTQKQLKRYWRQIGGKGPSPASEALDELSYAGRQFKMHLLYIGQRLSAKAVSGSGSADARENLGLIVFYNPSKGTWDLLTDGHEKPPDTTVKGRYQIVDPAGVTAIQSALWKNKEARRFAISGATARPHRDLPFTKHVGAVPLKTIRAEGSDQGFVSDVPGGPLAIGSVSTLSKAVSDGLLGQIGMDAARKRVQRAQLDHVGWDGSAKVYYVRDLKELVRD